MEGLRASGAPGSGVGGGTPRQLLCGCSVASGCAPYRGGRSSFGCGAAANLQPVGCGSGVLVPIGPALRLYDRGGLLEGDSAAE